MPVDWRINRVNDSTYDDDLIDVYLVDAFNRFARQATATFDDPDSDKDSVYERYEPVELEYRIPDLATGWTRRFAGFVADTSSSEEETEVPILSYDAFLRGRTVSRGYSSQTVSYILEDLLTDTELSPVSWAAGANVTVDNDETITREWKGEPLDVVIEELSVIADAGSSSHEWGANNDNEFFFRPRGGKSSPRDFKTGGYWDLEVNEEVKKPANRAKVFYGDVSEDGSVDDRDAVLVDRGSEQTGAQNKLGTSDPVIEPITKYYPQITSQAAAKRKANDLLDKHSGISTGNFTTYEALAVRPGDVATFENDPRGISTQVRVAQLTYRWKEDTTEVRYAENEAGVLDTLVVISDEVARLDARGQDSTATANRDINEDTPVEVEVAAKIEKFGRSNVFQAGEPGGGFGDTAVGGGVLGDSGLQKIETVIDEL